MAEQTQLKQANASRQIPQTQPLSDSVKSVLRKRMLSAPLKPRQIFALQDLLQNGRLKLEDLGPGEDGDPISAAMQRGDIRPQDLQIQPGESEQEVLGSFTGGTDPLSGAADLGGQLARQTGRGAALTGAGIAGGLESLGSTMTGGVSPRTLYGLEESVAAKFFNEMAQATGALNFDQNAGLTLRALDRGAEIFGGGLPITAGMTAGGISTFGFGKNIAVHALPKMGGPLKMFRNGMLELAKHPGQFQALDAALSTGAGFAGELSQDEGASQTVQAMHELAAVMGIPMTVGLFKWVGRFLGNITDVNRGRAEHMMQVAMAKWFGEDTIRAIESGEAATERIAALSGGKRLRVSVGGLTGNKTLLAAERAVGFDPETMGAANRTILFDATNNLKKSLGATENELKQFLGEGSNKTFFLNREAQTTFQARVNNLVQQELEELQRVKQENLDRLEQAIGAANTEEARKEIGERAFSNIAQLRSMANGFIRAKYNQLKDMAFRPSHLRPLVTAFSRLKQGRFANDLHPEVVKILDRIENTLAFSKVSPVPFDPAKPPELDPFTATFKKQPKFKRNDTSKNTLSNLNLIQSDIGEAITKLANEKNQAGVRQLNILRSGINRVWNGLADDTSLGAQNVALLRGARDARRQFATEFQDFELKTLFTKTSQNQLKTAPEDVLKKFVDPNSPRVFARAEQYMKIFGNNPEAKEIIQDELLRRLQSEHMKKPDRIDLIPAKVNNFKNKYREVIQSYGLEDKWNNLKAITDEYHANIELADTSSKALEKSALNHFFVKKNIDQSMNEMIDKNPDRFSQLHDEVMKTGDPFLQSSWRRAVAENLTNQMINPSLNRADTTIPSFTVEALDQAITKNRPVLEKVLGKGVVNDLIDMSRGIKFVEGNLAAAANLSPDELKKIDMPSVKLVTSLIRQVNQRILSPQFVGLNLSINTLEHLRSRMLREVFLEILQDPQKAARFARLGQQELFQPMWKGMFRHAFGVTARNLGMQGQVEIPDNEDLAQSVSNMQDVEQFGTQRVKPQGNEFKDPKSLRQAIQ